MNVSDVLKLPSFEGAYVLAGADGLDNDVLTATIVEAPDIQSWGREGQLLITSYYAFEDLSDEGMAEFFAYAEKIGIGGMVFKPERLLDTAPDLLVEHCEEASIPLIRIPAGTQYEGLLLDVLSRSLDSNLVILERFFDLHRRSMELALKQPTVLEIISQLRLTIHVDITFFDSTKNRRTTTSEELSAFSSPRLTEMADDQRRTRGYFDAELHYGDMMRRATAILIPSSDDQIYYLIVHTQNERLSPLDEMAIENTVNLLQMEVLKQNAVDRKLFFQNNNLVRDLLTEAGLVPDVVDDALADLGIDRYEPYEVLLLSIALEDPSEIDRREDVMLMARRRLKMLYPDTAYFESNDSIAFLHNYRSPQARYDMAGFESILGEVAALPAMPRFTYTAALSSAGTRRTIPSLYREVTSIARFFDNGAPRNLALRYDDLGIYKLLLQVGDESELMQFVDPRVARLHDMSEGFFETAAALCENCMNYQQTARQLFVHPKTVRYRTERIQRTCGLDFKSSDDRLQIVLGARVYRLLQGHRLPQPASRKEGGE